MFINSSRQASVSFHGGVSQGAPNGNHSKGILRPLQIALHCLLLYLSFAFQLPDCIPFSSNIIFFTILPLSLSHHLPDSNQSDAVVFFSEQPVNFISLTFRGRAEMSGCLSKSLGSSSFSFSFSSFKMGHEEPPKAKQGIVSVLGSDFDRADPSRAPHPLKRTLSADMSSKEGLAHNGFSSSLKNFASSSEEDEITNYSSSSDGGGDCRERAFQDIWSSIQEHRREEPERPGQIDLWSSILSQKASDDAAASKSSLPPPYVHPLEKKSASSLSEKSLEICTESLGSETGSDGFSSYPPSEPSESEEEKEGDEEEKREYSRLFDGEEFRVTKYNSSNNHSLCSKKVPPRSFPPPLPSLAHGDGPNLHMFSHRKNGRLVVEAVALPSQNCFRAQRQDGRLLLTLSDTQFTEEEHIKEEENETVNQAADNKIEEIKEEEEGSNEEDAEAEGRGERKRDNKATKELAIILESAHEFPAGMTNEQKLIAPTENSSCHHTFNEVVTTLLEAEDESSPDTTDAANLNAYEYNWRSKPAAVAVLKPLAQQTRPLTAQNNHTTNQLMAEHNYEGESGEQNELVVVVKGEKTEYLVPLLRGCKEQRRRSLILWKRYCIATT
ncbi:hypothetical protein Nepgr_014032 [Nepenthes gracilis]|uniref:FAF domain-containing protein n=1 Tax=Nepenthes gracilis TaxID=150966 RepID=A0AAD3SKT9_NEPGR|nr:hypothetical protein Nepgr_014032 [Nepenthes gracilis]